MHPLARILRDPAVVFVLVGALLFGLHALRSGAAPVDAEPQAGAPEPIVVDAERLEQLRRAWAQQAALEGSAAMPPEVERAIVEAWVRDEALYREADAIGLITADSVIRERALRKMTTLIEQSVAVPDPADADLEAWLAANPTAYVEPPRLALDLVQVTAGDGAREAAEAAAEALRGGADLDSVAAPGIEVASHDRLLRAQLVGMLGEEAAGVLDAAPTGTFFGPVPTSRGFAIARIRDRTPERRPPLEAIRDRVAEAWRSERRAALVAARIDEIVARYPIERVTP